MFMGELVVDSPLKFTSYLDFTFDTHYRHNLRNRLVLARVRSTKLFSHQSTSEQNNFNVYYVYCATSHTMLYVLYRELFTFGKYVFSFN